MAKKKKDKRTHNDLQKITHKTKDRVNTNPTKNRGWTQVPRKSRQFLLHFSLHSGEIVFLLQHPIYIWALYLVIILHGTHM
jgi:hypothetical protein